jgi:hypothetical protein
VADRLFLRETELIVGTKVPGTNAPVEPADALKFKNPGITPKDLNPTKVLTVPTGTFSNRGPRITFKVERTSESSANKAEISVYNLSQKSRDFITADVKGKVVMLTAGYQGDSSTIFFGDIVHPEISRSGPDMMMKLECGDAERSLTESHVEIGLGPGTTTTQLINLAARSLGFVPSIVADLIPESFVKGFAFAGTAKKLLDEITNKIGAKWSIQNGELQVHKKDGDIGSSAINISPTTGLIGWPTKTKDGVKFRSLLNPQIRPGRLVFLQSKQFTGNQVAVQRPSGGLTVATIGELVIVQKATFEGDTHGDAYHVEVEGAILGAQTS